MCLLHSRFIENHPIWILEDGPLISEVVLSQRLPAVEELLQISAMTLERLGTLLHQGVKGGLDDVVLVEVRSIDARASLLHA
jgi:hypothetical protein